MDPRGSTPDEGAAPLGKLLERAQIPLSRVCRSLPLIDQNNQGRVSVFSITHGIDFTRDGAPPSMRYIHLSYIVRVHRTSSSSCFASPGLHHPFQKRPLLGPPLNRR